MADAQWEIGLIKQIGQSLAPPSSDNLCKISFFNGKEYYIRESHPAYNAVVSMAIAAYFNNHAVELRYEAGDKAITGFAIDAERRDMK